MSIRLVLVNIDISLVLFNVAFGAFTDPRDYHLRLRRLSAFQVPEG